MPTREEHGLLWWGTEQTPAGQIAPNSCVAGLLKIDNDGNCSPNLDG